MSQFLFNILDNLHGESVLLVILLQVLIDNMQESLVNFLLN